MRNFLTAALILVLLPGLGLNAQTSEASASTKGALPAEREETQRLRDEIEKLKKSLGSLEERLAAQEKEGEIRKKAEADKTAAGAKADLQAAIHDLDRRVIKTERDSLMQRVHFGGDYRFETHSINATVPEHYDGMKLQNLLVKTLFTYGATGKLPTSINDINNTVAGHYGDYQYFTSNLTFNQLKQAMAQFPPAMQQQLFSMLLPATHMPEYKDNTAILYTNRFRLNMDSKLTDNLSVTARLSMYKVFGDSTGVQMFNGQPNSISIDGSTVGVPNSDILRVERAYFTWSNIGGLPMYLSIGRRPSTQGPPLHLREDEPRGGTPMGSLIDFQFDGITFGVHVKEHTALRLCYGLGYESGFGNANATKLPQDRLKSVHFLGGNFDIWDSEKTFVQATIARAFRVTDGFNGLAVFPVNPLTGDPVPPVVMRFSPSANLGNINLFGMLLIRRQGPFDFFVNGNYIHFAPNGVTTPFGGLVSDPFENPVDRSGGLLYLGLRYHLPNDGKTKLGFEYNHGSKYWFNFAQAEDDIIAPKTNTRGNVFETYVTHRLNKRFIFKADLIRYQYDYSGSGWHLGAPKNLDSVPILGFPTYKTATMFSTSLITRF